MKYRTLTLLLCLALGTGCAARITANKPTTKSDLQLYAFLSPFGDKLFLNLRITNLTSTPSTVLTKQPSLSGVSTIGRRVPYLGISYSLHGTIPSLPDLAPVILFKDETAAISIPLEPELAAVLKEPDVVFSIDYEIHEDIAARFGLWHGKLSLKESVASLLHK